MRNRHEEETAEAFDVSEWPDAQLDVDDEAFAAAIARGRGDTIAA